MKSLIAATVLAVASTSVLALNVGTWECRNLHNMGFVILTLEQTSDILGEYGMHYPATVTDAFGETHKASVNKSGLTLIWIWGKGTEHFQIDMEMSGHAYLLDFSGTSGYGITKEPEYELQCRPK